MGKCCPCNISVVGRFQSGSLLTRLKIASRMIGELSRVLVKHRLGSQLEKLFKDLLRDEMGFVTTG